MRIRPEDRERGYVEVALRTHDGATHKLQLQFPSDDLKLDFGGLTALEAFGKMLSTLLHVTPDFVATITPESLFECIQVIVEFVHGPDEAEQLIRQEIASAFTRSGQQSYERN